MTCPTKTNNAEIPVDYCAGTLDPARVDEFVQHIQTCDGCRRAVEAQREVWGALEGWTPPQVSPDFDARLYARIAREQAAPLWKRWWLGVLHPAGPQSFWKPAVGLVAACAVLAVGFLIRTPNPVDAPKRIRAENVDIEQVEQTLADLDMLTPSRL